MWLDRLAKVMSILAVLVLIGVTGFGVHRWLQSYQGQRALRLHVGSE
jgi:hypothetical protein